MLVVVAHPDDEALATGGLLARAADEGSAGAVVTATWAAGTSRVEELAEALAVLGAGEPRLLGFADARVPESAPARPRLVDAPLDDAVRRLVAHIRDVRPEVVVTHDAYGGLTGHPDHRHTHRVAVLAAQAAGLDQMYPDVGEPWQPEAVWFATHPRSALPMLAEVVGSRRSVHTMPDTAVTHVVDVRPWLRVKLAAIAAHRSEVGRGALPGVVVGLDDATQQRLLGTEWYVEQRLAPVTVP